MLRHMRTTISIEDELLERVKREAERTRRTVSQVLADAARLALGRGSRREERGFRLITFRGDGPQPGVDLDRTSALLDLDDFGQEGAGREDDVGREGAGRERG